MSNIKVCRECGSDEVYYDAYVNVNDPDDVETFDEVYCMGCHSSTKLTTKEA